MACRRFVKYIFQSLQDYTVCQLKEKHFLSILIDGATDASVTENELIYVRYVDHGFPVNHYLSIEDLKHAHSDGILESICRAFNRVGFENFKDKLIGFGSDGASVNLGAKGGVGAKLKSDVEHLIIIHCVAHRLELSATSATKDHIIMKDIQDLFQKVYKHYHYSPKAMRELRDIADALEMKVLKPGNLRGTRWLPHVQRALHVLCRNYKVIVTHFDQIVASNSATPEVIGRATFIGKKLKDHKFLFFIHLFLDIFDILSTLSLKMQKDDMILAGCTHMSLVELKSVHGKELGKFIASVANGMFRGVTLDKIETESVYRNQKQEILTVVSNAINKRFEATERDKVIRAAAKILSLSDYPKDTENLSNFGNEDIDTLACHFSNILNLRGFNFENIEDEWRDFKAYVKRHSDTFPLKALHRRTSTAKIPKSNHVFTNLLSVSLVIFLL